MSVLRSYRIPLIALAGILVLLAIYGAICRIPYRARSEDPAVEALLVKIRAMPQWEWRFTRAEMPRDHILTALKEISKSDTKQLREAERLYCVECDRNSRQNFDMGDKLFLIHRYVFKAPMNFELEKCTYPNGYYVPQDDHYRNMLWPFFVNDAGDLDLTDQDAAFNGPSYYFYALDEFDFFSEHFGRR